MREYTHVRTVVGSIAPSLKLLPLRFSTAAERRDWSTGAAAGLDGETGLRRTGGKRISGVQAILLFPLLMIASLNLKSDLVLKFR